MTKRPLALMLLASCLLAFRTTPDENDWLIVPGKRAGPITAKTTRSGLVRIFGTQNVSDEDVTVTEDGFQAGTIILKDQPEASLIIVWDQDSPDAHAKMIVFCQSDESTRHCRWHSDNGISFGTNLKTLEALNGRKFKLHGFEWDHSGSVISWNGGHLERLASPCGRLAIGLDPPEGPPSDQREALIEQVEGEGEFWSSDPPMQALNPSVDFMSFSFQPGCDKR